MESILALAHSVHDDTISRTAFRRLDKGKHEAENRLIIWGHWTRTREEGGYPTRSVHTKANEGGVAAGSPRPPTMLPDEVAEVDRIVARLPVEWQRVARANWQFGELPREERALRAGLAERSFRYRVDCVRREVARKLRL